MRELAPFALLVCACGAAVHEPHPLPTAAAAIAQPAASASSASPAEAQAAFDALSSRAPSLAPGMHEVARLESGVGAVDLVHAAAHDACLRVAFAASAPVTASLVDQTGQVLATTPEAAIEGALAERGPVCVRKGDVLRAKAEGAGARVRWMAWEAE